MVISTKHNPYPELQLHLSNQAIERVNDITFLGIRISAKLSWNIHIDVICKKACRTISLIHRNFHLAPGHLRHTLYITLVHPILEYSYATWHYLNKTLTNHLESVQRFTGSYCSPGTWNMMIFFPPHPFPPSKLVVTAQLWFMSSKFLPISLLLPMSLFLTLVPIQDITIPVRSTSSLVVLCSVKAASFILGLNFGISCLKMLRLVSLCLPSRLLSRLSSWTSCLLCYLDLFWSCEFLFWFCCSFWLFGLPFNLALLHYWVLPGFGRML